VSVARLPALFWLRAALLVALAGASALAIQYRNLDASFCGVDSACAKLRETEWANLWNLGPTLPEVALVLLGGVFVSSLGRHVVWAARATIVGSMFALLFLDLQYSTYQKFCWLCCTVDISVLVGGLASFVLLFRVPPERRTRAPLGAGYWLALAALALLAPA